MAIYVGPTNGYRECLEIVSVSTSGDGCLGDNNDVRTVIERDIKGRKRT